MNLDTVMVYIPSTYLRRVGGYALQPTINNIRSHYSNSSAVVVATIEYMYMYYVTVNYSGSPVGTGDIR